MVSFLRTPTAAFALPAALAVAAAAASTSATPKPQYLSVPFPSPGSPISRTSTSSVVVRNSRPIRLLPAVRMDSSVAVAGVVTTEQDVLQKDAALADILTEFMVDMKCDGCVKAVKNKLSQLDGIKHVDADLENQVVKVLGNSPVKTMAEALEQTGRKARLIGQGNPDEFLVSAAVAEFKGSAVFGVVRFGQVNMELARIEANFSGLSPGKHGWSINEFGDLTKGPASTGNVFNPFNKATSEEAIGNLGTLEVQENGEAQFLGYKETLRVFNLIGRSVIVYGTEDKSDSGIAAAVIARSAGVGENYKKLCTCDGVTIWESS